MDQKTIETLEFNQILEQLSKHCSFSVSAELAKSVSPTHDIVEAQRMLGETSEAVTLLEMRSGFSIGGARDIREAIDQTEHGVTLDPHQLLDIKYTLIASRNLKRSLSRLGSQFPSLYDLSLQISDSYGLIDVISKTLSDRGEILDSASKKLGQIRHDIRIVHDRLLNKLQRMLNDPNISPYLQEALVTQRDGRYVLPLRAEFKGKVKSIVHDQSSSGATYFIEPIGVVDLNNRFRELQLDERNEERRILTELSQLVGTNSYLLTHTLGVIADIDLALAKAKYGNEINGSQPKLHPLKTKANNHPGTIIKLNGARHPLLDPETVVPIDVILEQGTFALIITGPNTGGKTVTLKTIGLLALMSQSGLLIPADEGAEISIFKNIFADIGDEQSIEQSLSTFSGHITNIIRILKSADEKCLVILDELGAGTDPQEGAALARALLDHLVDLKITTLVTTHHPELKVYAHTKPGVTNACVEFDLKTLSPTYHLTIGLPGRSNALAIAQRLGLPDPIIHKAQSELQTEDIEVRELLTEIHRQREQIRNEHEATEQSRQEIEELKSKIIDRLEGIEEERNEILENARIDSNNLIEDLQREIQKTRRELERARQPLDIVTDIEEEAKEIELSIPQPVESSLPARIPQHNQSITLGTEVRLRNLKTKGIVTSLTTDEAEIQIGVMRVRTKLSDLEAINNEYINSEVEPFASHTDDSPLSERAVNRESIQKRLDTTPPPSPGFELDIRGKRAEEALDTLDRYMEKVYLSGLPFVRIIHGKGTGRLRTVVREALKNNEYVKSHESGKENEGGDGVTIAHMDVD